MMKLLLALALSLAPIMAVMGHGKRQHHVMELYSAGALRSGAAAKRAHADPAFDIYLEVMSLWQLFVNVEIGTPPQSIPLVIDSTIEYSFVPSIQCTTPQCTYMHENGFDRLASSSFSFLGGTTQLLVRDYVSVASSVFGSICSDVFSIGTQSFLSRFPLVTTTTSPKPTQLMYNGRLGFGFSGTNFPNPYSLLPGIFQGGVPKIISYYVYDFSSYGVVGGFEVGGFSEDLVEMSTWRTFHNYHPENGNWAIGVSNVGVNGIMLGYNAYAVLDASTPFFICPVAVFHTLSALINFAGHGGVLMENSQQDGGFYYKIPCSAAASLPNMHLVIGGVVYTIPPEIYLIGNGEECVSILFGDPGLTSWVLGNALHRGSMVSYDFENGTVSFGALKPLKK